LRKCKKLSDFTKKSYTQKKQKQQQQKNQKTKQNKTGKSGGNGQISRQILSAKVKSGLDKPSKQPS